MTIDRRGEKEERAQQQKAAAAQVGILLVCGQISGPPLFKRNVCCVNVEFLQALVGKMRIFRSRGGCRNRDTILWIEMIDGQVEQLGKHC